MKIKLPNYKIIFRGLRNRNYRLFFIGQTISLIGTWMQQIAMSWLVYRLTNSALLLGTVGFIGQLPTFLFAPIAGVIADRHSRHRLLVATQILSMIQALILAVLVLTHVIAVWHIMVLSVFLGLINSFDMPIRQAFTIEMIENKEDLSNAIALNSSMINMAKLIGPSIAGMIIAIFGEGLCFLVNGLSYIAVIISLLLMTIKRKVHKSSQGHMIHELKEGFTYAFNFAPIKWILILLGLVSLTGVPYQVLMPIFAKDVFMGSSKTLGFLMAMSGIGALLGGMYLASRKNVAGLTLIIFRSAALFGLGIMGFALSKWLWLAMIVMAIVGFNMMVGMGACNMILQTVAEEDKRGRVMSLYTMAFMGMTPFGCLIAGTLAGKIGAPNTLLISGACCIMGAFLYYKQLPILRRHIRPIYIEKGIIIEKNTK